MTSYLVAVPTPEDRELAQLLLEIEMRRHYLAALESERDDLERHLGRFAAEVRQRVGSLKDEIRDLRAELDDVRQRIARLRADPDAEPADIEEHLAAEMAAEAAMNDRARTRREETPPPAPPARRMRSFAHEAEILRLYRDLAKRHHPDLAQTPEERERRTQMMLRINVAYRDRDLETLQSLQLAVEYTAQHSPAELARRRISWARHELSRVNREVQAVSSRLAALRASETYGLWRAEMEHATSLADIEQRTRERLAREQKRLKEAQLQYNRMAIRRQIMQRRAAAQTVSASHD